MFLIALLAACTFEVPEPGEPAPTEAVTQAPADEAPELGPALEPVVPTAKDHFRGAPIPDQRALTADITPWMEAGRIFSLPADDGSLSTLAGSELAPVRAAAIAKLWKDDKAVWGKHFVDTYSVPLNLEGIETTYEDVLGKIMPDVAAVEGLGLSPSANHDVTMLVGFLHYRNRPEYFTVKGKTMSVSRFFRSALLKKVSGAGAKDLYHVDQLASQLSMVQARN